jgi:hypothetical protein
MRVWIVVSLMLPVLVGCKSRPSQLKVPVFHVISADPCNLALIGTVGKIKYTLKTKESYYTDTTGKHLTFLTKEEYDEQVNKWLKDKTVGLPPLVACAGLPMDAAGKDFSVVVDNQRGVVVITEPVDRLSLSQGKTVSTQSPTEKQTTTYTIEHEEEVSAASFVLDGAFVTTV